MKYLIIDKDYRIFTSDVYSGIMRKLVTEGKLSVIYLPRLRGVNIDGETWSEFPAWESEAVDNTQTGS